MRHLSEAELIDLAEGTRPEASASHLASCEACRVQLNDLRAMFTEAAAVDVPEPSPLFWDHLSARVRESIAAEQLRPARASTWWLIPAGALAAIAVAALMTLGRNAQPSNTPTDPAPAVADASAGASERISLADDPSLSLIADMAGDLDWDAAAEAGLTGGIGTVDRAVLDLTSDERVELQRILKEELSKS
jgi:hypothetical protein